MSDGPIIIDTPEGMAHFAMAQCISRLRLETKTGLKFRQSTLAAVQRHYGITARTKAKALVELEALYEQTYGRKYGEKTETS